MTPSQTVLITVPYYAPRLGGLEIYAQAIAEGLHRLGWRVVVACGDTTTKHLMVDNIGGIRVWRLPIARVISNTPVDHRWYSWLRNIIRIEQPDIINTHMPVPFMADMTVLAAGHIPVVITYHAATLFKPSSLAMRLASHGYGAAQRFTLGRAKAIIAVSDYVKTALGVRYAPKTEVIYNAVHPPSDLIAAQSQGGGLVFVANLAPTHHWKGLHLILEALGRLKAAGHTVPHLTVIGDGASRPHYETQAERLGISPYIFFAGRQTGPDRDQLMRRAVALIAYPTTANDAFPTVFLEAWALGLPVVGAAIGPIPSLLEENGAGIVVPPNQPEALADALQSLLSNPAEIEAMGERGRKLVEAEYNWNRQVARTAKLLESLL